MLMMEWLLLTTERMKLVAEAGAAGLGTPKQDILNPLSGILMSEFDGDDIKTPSSSRPGTPPAPEAAGGFDAQMAARIAAAVSAPCCKSCAAPLPSGLTAHQLCGRCEAR